MRRCPGVRDRCNANMDLPDRRSCRLRAVLRGSVGRRGPGRSVHDGPRCRDDVGAKRRSAIRIAGCRDLGTRAARLRIRGSRQERLRVRRTKIVDCRNRRPGLLESQAPGTDLFQSASGPKLSSADDQEVRMDIDWTLKGPDVRRPQVSPGAKGVAGRRVRCDVLHDVETGVLGRLRRALTSARDVLPATHRCQVLGCGSSRFADPGSAGTRGRDDGLYGSGRAMVGRNRCAPLRALTPLNYLPPTSLRSGVCARQLRRQFGKPRWSVARRACSHCSE